MMDVGRLLGRGIGFRPDIGTDGRLAWSAGEKNIEESIQIILLTEPGERVMIPDFGAGLKRFLFEPNTVTTHRLIEEEIIQSLAQWEPRIEVDVVDIEVDGNDPQVARVTLCYKLIANRISRRLQLRLQLAG